MATAVISPLYFLSSAANTRLSLSPYRRRRTFMASSDATGEVAAVKDVLVQYIVLRRDLIDTWPLGSVVTQGCHAAVAAVWAHKDDDHTLEYCSPDNIDSMHKVI